MEALYEQLGRPGARALFVAAKRQGLNVSEKQVKTFLATRAEKQQFSAPELSKEK